MRRPLGSSSQHCPACGAAVADAARYCGQCGTALPNAHGLAVPAAGPPGPHDAGPRRPAGRNRIRWIVGGVAAGLALIATISLVFVPLAHDYLIATNPLDTVRAYFQALADRDADRARSWLAPDQDSDAAPGDEQGLLSARTLRDPGYTPPRHVQVAVAATPAPVPVAQRQQQNLTVRAQFDGADGQQAILLRLSRPGAGPLDSWVIADGLTSFRLPQVDIRDVDLLVAGNTVPANTPDLLRVFPGSYAVTLPKDPISEAAPFTEPNRGSDRLPLRVRQDAQAAAQRQVRAYLDGCAASNQQRVANCPFGVWSNEPITDIQYKITNYPVLTFTVMNLGIARVLGTSGRFQVTARYARPGGQTFTEEREFVIDGRLRTDDAGKPSFMVGS